MQLIVRGDRADQARFCELAIHAEIDRLSSILSTYSASSQICSVMRGAAIESPEIADILKLYDRWNSQTSGAIHVNMGGVRSLWKQAENLGELPKDADLHAAFAAPRNWNVDALGKAYIIDRAVEVARRIAPSGLLNIGGDLRAWGEDAWLVGVADPANAADNAPPASEFVLRDAAVATSGSYHRPIRIGGKRYSHILDPRTLYPIESTRRSATVIAHNCVAANALATAACVLEFEQGQSLARTFGLGHLLLDSQDASGEGIPLPQDAPSDSFSQMPVAAAATEGNWPRNYQVSIEVALKRTDDSRAKRPYVAIWIEDENEKVVRNLNIWGDRDKYLPELSAWWNANHGNERLARTLTSATRPPGKYTVVWNGRDDEGNPVPAGTYHVFVEINREHGRHAREWAPIECGEQPASATLRATPESDESKVDYGPRNK